MSKQSKNQKSDPKKPRNVPLAEEPQKKEQVPKILKEIFSEWSDESLLAALNDYNGDINMTISRISEGHVQQWSSTKKEKQPSKKTEGTKVVNNDTPRTNQTPRNFEGQKRETKFENSNNSNKTFDGKHRSDYKPGENRKPREFVRKENISTTDWSTPTTSSSTSWDAPQQTTQQPVQPQPSSIAPWADKSKLNQPQQTQQQSQHQQLIPENTIKIEPEVKSVYAPTFAPVTNSYQPTQHQHPQHQQHHQQLHQPQHPQHQHQQLHQPQQPSKSIEKPQEKPIMPTTTIPTEQPKPSQPELRIPTANPISKFPQPQLPPPMTNPNTFGKGFVSRQVISAPSQEVKSEKHSEPTQGGLRFGTTGLSGEELPPIEAPQRAKKEETLSGQVETTTQFQNPPGFGVPIPIGYTQEGAWNARTFLPQNPDQTFRPQEVAGGQPYPPMYVSYSTMPFYGPMYQNKPQVFMYKQSNYPQVGTSQPSRPIQPGMTFDSNDFKYAAPYPQAVSARPSPVAPSTTASTGNASSSSASHEFKPQPPFFSYSLNQPQMGQMGQMGQMNMSHLNHMGQMSQMGMGQMNHMNHMNMGHLNQMNMGQMNQMGQGQTQNQGQTQTQNYQSSWQ